MQEPGSETAIGDKILVPSTPYYMAEPRFLRVLQPGSNAEILLSGVLQDVWAFLTDRRQATGAELRAFLKLRYGDEGEAGAEAVVRRLEDLRLLQLVDEGGW